MEKIEAIYPTHSEMQRIIDWFSLSISGRETTIFIPICPDYSVEPLTNSRHLFRHTFSSLGSGNGLIAQRIINALPIFYETFTKLNIQPKIVIGIADFEAFSESTLKRVNLTKNEFLNKVDLSRIAFSNEANLPTFMMTDLFGGVNSWINCVNNIKKSFKNGYFGAGNISTETLLNIAKKRKLLYNRWFGGKNCLEEYIPIVLEQGADYAAMGSFIAEKLKNCLVVGADNEILAPFYSFVKPISTLYLKRYYC
jgi:hypothetical protein